jgi:WhiB family redox-sensing transcriptional regulator
LEHDELDIGDWEEAEMELGSSWALVDSDMSWQDQAACRGMSTDLFFIEVGDPDQRRKMQVVRELCGSCPVQKRCLEWAVVNMIPSGFWGGVAPRARRTMRALGVGGV